MHFSRQGIMRVCPDSIEPDMMLWEAKHTKEQLAVILGGDPYTGASQYQQAPTGLGGGMFKEKYWKHYSLLPSDCGPYIMFCDTAQKTSERNDYTSMQVWTHSPTSGIYLVDHVHGRFEAPILESKLVELWEKHKPTVHKPVGLCLVKVEDKSSGSSLIQSIKQDYLIPIEGIQRNTDKVLRAMGAVKYFASGFIHLPESAPWLSDYKEEFRKFTPLMTHPFDDQIDPTLDAVEHFLVFERHLYNDSSL